MPRYHFHFREGDRITKDDEGMELADEEAAVREAMFAAKEMIAQALLRGEPVPRQAEFDVTDSEGRHLCSLPFSFAADYSIAMR
jgi:hypothetical protein